MLNFILFLAKKKLVLVYFYLFIYFIYIYIYTVPPAEPLQFLGAMRLLLKS